MKKVLIVFLGFFSIGNLIAQDLNPEVLIAKYLQTIGQDKVKNLQTIKRVGKVAFKNKMTVPFTSTEKRPDLFRFEYNWQGSMVIYAGNEKDGWMIDPRTGSSDPQDVPSIEIKQDISDYQDPYANWDNPFINWKEREDKLELIGTEDVKGIPVYNIKLTAKDNNYINFYMDTAKYIILKIEYSIKSAGRTFEAEELFSDFKSVDDILVPFRYEEFINNQKAVTITVDRYEFNSPIFDLMFRKPVLNKK
jgi:outer membrane lipoprotein-sorting protein